MVLCESVTQPGRNSEETLQIIFPLQLFVRSLPHFFLSSSFPSWFSLPVSLFSSHNLTLLCFCHDANFLQLSTLRSFVRESLVQIPRRCFRWGNWGFSLFYSFPRGEFKGRISNYTMTAFFHYLCNSFLAIFRRFVNIRSYILTNRNVDWEVQSSKVNKLRFMYFSSIYYFFLFVRDWQGERHTYVGDHARPSVRPTVTEPLFEIYEIR